MLEVKHFPHDMSALELDYTDPKRCLISGLFEESVKVGDTQRRFYTYIAPGLCSNQPCLVLAPPEDVPVLDFLEQGFWLNFAQERQIFLHILEPVDDKYRLDGTDAAYMNRVYVEIQSRKFYVTMQDNIYAVGIGGGAAVAQQAAMEMASEWSGLATFGEMAPEVLHSTQRVHTGENTGKTELVLSGTKAQLPVWMAWEANAGTNAEVCDYWKGQNDADGEAFSNRWADEIYFPSRVCKRVKSTRKDRPGTGDKWLHW